MIALISPSKTMDFETTSPLTMVSFPRFQGKTMQLVKKMKKQKAKQLQKLMDISSELAILNVDRYQNFSDEFNLENSKPAIYAFKGEVYIGFEAEKMDEKDVLHAQDCVRMLSGLYGLLRPLDMIQPYRLEMGLPVGVGKAKTLYQFWKKELTAQLIDDIKKGEHDLVLNLASTEYFKAVDKKVLPCPVLEISFKERRNGKLIFVSFNGKKARGQMCKFMVENKIRDKESLKGFDEQGYLYSEENSSEWHWMFIKE